MDPEVAHELMEKLGLATNELVRIFSEVQPVLGLIHVIAGVCGVITWIAVIKIGWDSIEKKENKVDGSDVLMLFMVGMWGGIIVGVGLDLLGTTLLRLWYPEYFAVKEILGLLGS